VMRKALARAMHGFLRARRSEAPPVSDAMRAHLVSVADFTTRARSAVMRDGYSRQLEYAPEPEAPTRFAKVLFSLASGVALAYDSPQVTLREIRLVLRVALDCLPPMRRMIIELLGDFAGERPNRSAPTTREIADRLPDSSLSYIRRTLEDLHALKIVRRIRSDRKGDDDRWALKKRPAEVFALLTNSESLGDASSEVSGTALTASTGVRRG